MCVVFLLVRHKVYNSNILLSFSEIKIFTYFKIHLSEIIYRPSSNEQILLQYTMVYVSVKPTSVE